MNIYVGNLSWDVTDEDLRQAFAEFGQVEAARVVNDSFTGRSRGFGFVEMPEKTEGDAAIQALNNRELKGRAIKVNEARPKGEGGRDRRPPRPGGFSRR